MWTKEKVVFWAETVFANQTFYSQDLVALSEYILSQKVITDTIAAATAACECAEKKLDEWKGAKCGECGYITDYKNQSDSQWCRKFAEVVETSEPTTRACPDFVRR